MNPQFEYSAPISNRRIRQYAYEKLEGNWNGPVVTTLVYFIITGILESLPPQTPHLGFFDIGGVDGEISRISILSTLFSGALSIGLSQYFLNFTRNEHAEISDIFSGFQQILQAIIAAILMSVIIIIGIIFLIVPGVIAALGLGMTYFIMADHPGISAIDAMRESWEMMKGHKGQFFLLILSFIPWFFLTVFTLFIGMLWAYPYMMVSISKFYMNVSGQDDEDEFSLEDHLIAD